MDALGNEIPPPRLGHGVALRVPVSQGSASYELEEQDFDNTQLMESEPTLEPLRAMEAGATWTPEAERRIHELDRPIHPAPF